MPTGPKVFLALLDACGLRPCDLIHLKNDLVLNRKLVGLMINIGARFWTLVQSEAPKSNNGRLEAVRLPTSAGLPPGGRAAL